MFINGCPSCGYAGKDQPGIAGLSSVQQMKDAHKKNYFYVHKKHPSSAQKNAAKRCDGSLPAWIYAVTLVALVAIIAGVMRCAL